MGTEPLIIAMLGLLGFGVFSGFPVALVLAATGLAGFVAAVAIGVTDFGHLGLIYLRVRGLLTSEVVQFTTVPLLIFLGLVLNASGIAAILFRVLGQVLKAVPGRYAIATLLIGLILAPAAGVIGASVVTVALSHWWPMGQCCGQGILPRSRVRLLLRPGRSALFFHQQFCCSSWPIRCSFEYH